MYTVASQLQWTKTLRFCFLLIPHLSNESCKINLGSLGVHLPTFSTKHITPLLADHFMTDMKSRTSTGVFMSCTPLREAAAPLGFNRNTIMHRCRSGM